MAKMLRRVLIFRRVAAAHVSAFQAKPQMHPRVAHLHALFANVLIGIRQLDLTEMFARRHVTSLAGHIFMDLPRIDAALGCLFPFRC